MKINFCVLFLALSVTAHGSHKHKHAEDEVEEEHHREVSLNATSNHNHSISTFRKSDPCVPKFELDEYDVGLHVLSIFVLVVVSLMGSVSPVLLSNRFNGIKSRFILHLGLLFGAGTILSTGFIHMLGPAFKTLSDPCIGTLWSVTYDSFAGVFAILAILIMQLLQLTMTAFFSGQQKKTSCEEISAHNIEDSKKTDGHHHHHHHHHHPGSLPKDVRLNKRIALSLLEVGIALHSIVIGIALGISTGSEFTALFVALCFHQFFEGLALGSTISAAEFSKVKSMLLACVYGVTTPLGIGIGMAVRTFYSPDSPDGLLVTGIMDSMSGGVLIYTALVEFLDIKTIVNEEFNEFGFASKFLSVAACWLGCAVMAVLGLWA